MSRERQTCPDCGIDEQVVSFREGVCWYCHGLNQTICDQHNIEHDRWAKMTDKERTDEIIRACDDAP